MKPDDTPFPISQGLLGFVALLFGAGFLAGFFANFVSLPKPGVLDRRRELASAFLGGVVAVSAGLIAYWKTGLGYVGLAVGFAAGLIGDVVRRGLEAVARAWFAKKVREYGGDDTTTLDDVRQRANEGEKP